MSDLIDVPDGLAGVAVADTTVGDVRGREGFYHYRGYDATALARRYAVEDVWQLLVDGELPAPGDASFAREVAPLRQVPPATWAALPTLASSGQPLDQLRSALSLAAQELELRPVLDATPAQRRSDALRIAALVSPLVAALHRSRTGQRALTPDPDLPVATDHLRMLLGTTPTPAAASALGRYLIATADHGFNASTFTARVVASTGADIGSAVVAAVGALSGPLHGGAPSRALEMLDELASPDDARAYVRDVVADGGRVMGFGHRVYRTADPRAPVLREVATELGGERVQHAEAIEAAVVETLAELKPGRDLNVNVEFWAAVVLEACGIPRDLFTATFATSRVLGWTAHVLEQAQAGRIVRPSARYTGPPAPRPLPGETELRSA